MLMVEAIEKKDDKKLEFGPIANRDIADGLVCQLAAQGLYASVKVREDNK